MRRDMQRTMDYSMKVRKITVPKGHRIIITSDIHGNLSYLKGLLDKVSFSKEDYFFIAGDLVEKGGDSLATLRYLMELERTHHVYMVYGNVDASVLENMNSVENFYKRYCRMMKHWGNSIYEEMLREQGKSLAEQGERSPQAVEMERRAGGWAKKAAEEISAEEALFLIREKYDRELSFIQSLPVLIDAGTFLVTHAGLPTEDYKELSAEEVYRMIKWESFQDVDLHFSRYVYVGHWPVTIYERGRMDSSPLINQEKKIISLDGGCAVKRDGQLNAVVLSDIDSEDFQIVSYDDFPRAIVLEAKKGREGEFCSRWSHRFVEEIKKDGEGSLVRFLHNGEESWVPAPYLWEEGEGLSCSDYTNSELALDAGDTVSVIGSYRKGYLVRKDGVLGWYYGALDICGEEKWKGDTK